MWSERIAHEALKHGKVIQVILNVYKTHTKKTILKPTPFLNDVACNFFMEGHVKPSIVTADHFADVKPSIVTADHFASIRRGRSYQRHARIACKKGNSS